MATFESAANKKSSIRTKTAFFNAFVKLMKKKSFEEISVSDLIQEAGYSRTTFYSYYQDKFDMIEIIINDEAVKFINALCGPIPIDNPLLFDSDIYLPGLSLFEYIEKQKDFYSLLIHNQIPNYSMDVMCKKISNVMKRVITIETEASVKNLNFDLYCYISTDTYLSFIKYWEIHNFSFTPEYMAKQMMTNWVKVKKVGGVSVKELPATINILDIMREA